MTCGVAVAEERSSDPLHSPPGGPSDVEVAETSKVGSIGVSTSPGRVNSPAKRTTSRATRAFSRITKALVDRDFVMAAGILVNFRSLSVEEPQVLKELTKSDEARMVEMIALVLHTGEWTASLHCVRLIAHVTMLVLGLDVCIIKREVCMAIFKRLCISASLYRLPFSTSERRNTLYMQRYYETISALRNLSMIILKFNLMGQYGGLVEDLERLPVERISDPFLRQAMALMGVDIVLMGGEENLRWRRSSLSAVIKNNQGQDVELWRSESGYAYFTYTHSVYVPMNVPTKGRMDGVMATMDHYAHNDGSMDGHSEHYDHHAAKMLIEIPLVFGTGVALKEEIVFISQVPLLYIKDNFPKMLSLGFKHQVASVFECRLSCRNDGEATIAKRRESLQDEDGISQETPNSREQCDQLEHEGMATMETVEPNDHHNGDHSYHHSDHSDHPSTHSMENIESHSRDTHSFIRPIMDPLKLYEEHILAKVPSYRRMAKISYAVMEIPQVCKSSIGVSRSMQCEFSRDGMNASEWNEDAGKANARHGGSDGEPSVRPSMEPLRDEPDEQSELPSSREWTSDHYGDVMTIHSVDRDEHLRVTAEETPLATPFPGRQEARSLLRFMDTSHPEEKVTEAVRHLEVALDILKTERERSLETVRSEYKDLRARIEGKFHETVCKSQERWTALNKTFVQRLENLQGALGTEIKLPSLSALRNVIPE